MKRSFTNLLIFYIFGIFIFYSVEIPDWLIISSFIITILYLSYNIIKSSLNQSILLSFMFILGISMSFLNSSGDLEAFSQKEVPIKAVVEDLEKKTEEFEKYNIKVIEADGRKIYKERSILTVIGHKDLRLGSTIVFKAKTRIPDENTNPGLFNHKLYLQSKKTYTTMSVDSNVLEILNQEKIGFRYRLKENSIRKIESLFKPYLNETNNSLVTSIILGDSSYLEDSNRELYRDMGLAHVLAVSGLHIGIITSFLMFIFSRLGIKLKTNVLITLVFIWSYGYIISYPPSILRASLLFSFLYLSRIIHKPYDSLNILSLAGIILLLINPYSLFSIGFQLSFAASASIIIFTERVGHIFYPLKGKFIDTLSSLIAVNLGVSPLQIFYFNKFSILGILANIIIVPILSFSLILAFIMIAIEFVYAGLNSYLGWVLNTSLNIQFFLLRLIDRSPINIIRVFSPDKITLALIFLFIFIIFDLVDIKSFKLPMQRVIVVYLSLLIVLNFLSIKENMEIHFIDVGQGDSIYIRSGKKDILIDTGGSIFKSNNISQRIVLPYLEKLGVRKLDAIFISHFHEDHSQGLPMLLESFKVGHIFASHEPQGDYEGIIKDDRFKILRAGDSIDIDKNTSFNVVWPRDDMEGESNLNNKSMVGVLKYRGRKIFLTGDMEEEAEASLIDRVEEVDILKVAHHGSSTSSTREFIEKLNAKAAIISVGRNNMYKHPSEKTVNDLEEIGSEVYRTDRDGLVKLTIDDSIYIEPYLIDGKKQKRRIEDYILYNEGYFLSNSLFLFISYLLIKRYAQEELTDDLQRVFF
nr:DNA internalization-related competence protein ComEC/Rec2 [Tissierella sp.]